MRRLLVALQKLQKIFSQSSSKKKKKKKYSLRRVETDNLKHTDTSVVVTYNLYQNRDVESVERFLKSYLRTEGSSLHSDYEIYWTVRWLFRVPHHKTSGTRYQSLES